MPSFVSFWFAMLLSGGEMARGFWWKFEKALEEKLLESSANLVRKSWGWNLVVCRLRESSWIAVLHWMVEWNFQLDHQSFLSSKALKSPRVLSFLRAFLSVLFLFCRWKLLENISDNHFEWLMSGNNDRSQRESFFPSDTKKCTIFRRFTIQT